VRYVGDPPRVAKDSGYRRPSSQVWMRADGSLPDDPLLHALGWEPATLEQLAERLDAPLGPIAVRLAELETAGQVVQRAGWCERVR